MLSESVNRLPGACLIGLGLGLVAGVWGTWPGLATATAGQDMSAPIGTGRSQPQTQIQSSLSDDWDRNLVIAQRNTFSTFFSEGRLDSENMSKLRRSPNPQIPIDTVSQFWQPVWFTGGRFALFMPPGLLSEETVVLNTTVGPLSFRTLASNAEGSRYVAGYSDRLTAAQLAQPQVLLQAILDRVAPSDKFQGVSNTPVTLSGYAGRELTLKSDAEAITFRIYLVDQQIYALGARYERADTPPQRVTGFLNGLQFLTN